MAERPNILLYDRRTDPHAHTNLATDPAHRDLVAAMLTRLEALIDDEIGTDERAWVAARPRLVRWLTWRGDAA
ncbi:MAG: hypothetical protein HOQ22_02310 [Nocardioidaceae bacterium]|nr:hypothetical protein [Nocardioidaceae bacterium]NUS49858.1 hypothetical protein [Nocardioidaceae bacterium]